MSKPISKDAARQLVLEQVRTLAHYWSRQPNQTPREMCDGLAFSILSMIDGAGQLPGMDLVLRPHPEDKAFHESEGEDYFKDGMTINDDVNLHDLYYPKRDPEAGH